MGIVIKNSKSGPQADRLYHTYNNSRCIFELSPTKGDVFQNPLIIFMKKFRYRLSLVSAFGFQLIAMTFLVLFFVDAVSASSAAASSLLALSSLCCSMAATALFAIADHCHYDTAREHYNAAKPKRHYKEWSERTWNIIFGLSIFAIYAVFMIFMCTH